MRSGPVDAGVVAYKRNISSVVAGIVGWGCANGREGERRESTGREESRDMCPGCQVAQWFLRSGWSDVLDAASVDHYFVGKGKGKQAHSGQKL